MAPYLNIYIYTACLLASCAYAFSRGQRPERLGAVINLAGSALSFLVAVSLPFRPSATATAVIDLAVCGAFLWLMLASRRLWLIPCFGFAAAGLAAHVGRVTQAEMPRLIYHITEAKWAYINLMLLVLGTWRHPRKARTARR